jgi:hypothetical protein
MTSARAPTRTNASARLLRESPATGTSELRGWVGPLYIVSRGNVTAETFGRDNGVARDLRERPDTVRFDGERKCPKFQRRPGSEPLGAIVIDEVRRLSIARLALRRREVTAGFNTDQETRHLENRLGVTYPCNLPQSPRVLEPISRGAPIISTLARSPRLVAGIKGFRCSCSCSRWRAPGTPVQRVHEAPKDNKVHRVRQDPQDRQA